MTFWYEIENFIVHKRSYDDCDEQLGLEIVYLYLSCNNQFQKNNEEFTIHTILLGFQRQGRA